MKKVGVIGDDPLENRNKEGKGFSSTGFSLSQTIEQQKISLFFYYRKGSSEIKLTHQRP